MTEHSPGWGEGRLLEESEDSGEGNSDPGGTVVEFVEKLIERLFQEISLEE